MVNNRATSILSLSVVLLFGHMIASVTALEKETGDSSSEVDKRQYFDSLGGMAMGKRQYFDSLGGMAMGKRQYFDSLGGMAMGKRQYFDSLGGMAMGKRQYFDSLGGMAMGKRQYFDSLGGMAMGKRGWALGKRRVQWMPTEESPDFGSYYKK